MKVSAVINIINTYNNYQRKISKLIHEKQCCEAFDDDSGVKEIQMQIDEVNKELGQFLDMEA